MRLIIKQIETRKSEARSAEIKCFLNKSPHVYSPPNMLFLFPLGVCCCFSVIPVTRFASIPPESQELKSALSDAPRPGNATLFMRKQMSSLCLASPSVTCTLFSLSLPLRLIIQGKPGDSSRPCPSAPPSLCFSASLK